MISLILGVGTCAKNIYTIHVAGFVLKGTNKQCVPQYDSNYWLDEMFVWLDLMIGSIIPFVVITVSNTGLMVAIWKRRVVPLAAVHHSENKKEGQLTALLLLVSTTFLLCTLPRTLLRSGETIPP